MIRSNNIFNFGKYKGRRVIDVAHFDPSYIYFCENRMGLKFTPKVKRECTIASWERKIYSTRQHPLFS